MFSIRLNLPCDSSIFHLPSINSWKLSAFYVERWWISFFVFDFDYLTSSTHSITFTNSMAEKLYSIGVCIFMSYLFNVIVTIYIESVVFHLLLNSFDKTIWKYKIRCEIFETNGSIYRLKFYVLYNTFTCWISYSKYLLFSFFVVFFFRFKFIIICRGVL